MKKNAPVKDVAGKKTEKKPAKKTVKKVRNTEEFAVIETGGKQYVVTEGDVITIEKLSGDFKAGDRVTFDKVLLVDNGKDTTIGTPYIKGAKVVGSFEETGKGKKIYIIKFKSKSRYARKAGHRQPYTKVRIEALK
ncbi:50S ribosomal protein L21 [Candidatus Kaiserbacteria bacterium]|nr:50S ribosomal protein L21 [Candidatus Kaiserbacteria bacterium]